MSLNEVSPNCQTDKDESHLTPGANCVFGASQICIHTIFTTPLACRSAFHLVGIDRYGGEKDGEEAQERGGGQF